MEPTMTVTSASPLVYSYRLRESDKTTVVRRLTGETDHEFVTRLRYKRSKLFEYRNGQPPDRENLTVYSKPVRTPDKCISRHSEIAEAIRRLCDGTSPARQPYIVDRPRY